MTRPRSRKSSPEPRTSKLKIGNTPTASDASLREQLVVLTRELQEANEHKVATSHVLKAIGRSTVNLETVLDTLIESACRLCAADIGTIRYEDGAGYRLAATYGCRQEWRSLFAGYSSKPDLTSVFGQTIIKGHTVHIPDVLLDHDYARPKAQQLMGLRAALGVPLIRSGHVFGVVNLFRTEPQPFTEKQIGLAESFSDQAVVAIENARLLNELNKLNQQLERRVADQVEEIERMGRLRRFLPPQVADLIVASGTEKQLESHRREITALFCDLRGFTGFSESSDPEDVMALLRDYHAAIGEIIVKYNGTLERYAGDGVMVIFNDPVPVPNAALQAVNMALDMRVAIGALIEKWRRIGHDLGFGIGIENGFATLGTIGFEGRFDYAAIGTVSNVASRLCDEAKAGQILISPRVLLAVEDSVTVEAVGEFELKGIRRPMAAYNLLATRAAK
jgi:class 3 adenylate cyclase